MLTIDTKPSYHSTSFSAICISGSSVKSWSINFKIDLSDFEVQEKLQDFKNSVRLKSSSMAFAIFPSDESDFDRRKIDIFKNVFPSVTLISLFNNRSHVILSSNSTSDGKYFLLIKKESFVQFMKFTITETDPDLKHFNCYAYLILTYNLL